MVKLEVWSSLMVLEQGLLGRNLLCKTTNRMLYFMLRLSATSERPCKNFYSPWP